MGISRTRKFRRDKPLTNLFLAVVFFTASSFPLASSSLAASSNTSTAYDSWVRHSVYVPANDGTRLALDYYRPTHAGNLHSDPLPVVWRFTPYARYKLDENGGGQSSHALPQYGGGLNGPKALQALLEAGYIVAVADWRGYSASFGVSETWLGLQQVADARDITDWLADQPWSTDAVGMMGLSALASVQYLAATDASEHLKAIFPAMGQLDHYETFYLNGIFRPDLPLAWDNLVRPPLDIDGCCRTVNRRSCVHGLCHKCLWNDELGGFGRAAGASEPQSRCLCHDHGTGNVFADCNGQRMIKGGAPF